MIGRCPNCGYMAPEPPRPPYAYDGYLKPRLPEILTLLRAGLDAEQVSHALGLNNGPMVHYIRKRYGIVPEPQHGASDRNAEMVTRHEAGEGYTALAAAYGLSPTRVRQIILRFKQRQVQAAGARLARKDGTRLEDVALKTLDLPARIANCFRNEGFRTVGEAMAVPDYRLLHMPNFGRDSLRVWRSYLGALQREFEAAP